MKVYLQLKKEQLIVCLPEKRKKKKKKAEGNTKVVYSADWVMMKSNREGNDCRSRSTTKASCKLVVFLFVVSFFFFHQNKRKEM
jgi:hypothetical protein